MPQEEKIQKFVEAITREAAERREQVTRETEEYLQNELKKAEEEALSESFSLIQRRAAAIREEFGRDLSKKQMAQKKEMVAKRDTHLNEVFSKVRERLLAYSKTPEYRADLLASVKMAQEALGTLDTITIKPDDEPFSSELEAASGAKVNVDSDILLGGLRFENAGHTISADDTLDTRLENQRDWLKVRCRLHFN